MWLQAALRLQAASQHAACLPSSPEAPKQHPWMLPAAQLLPHSSLPLSAKAGSKQLPSFSWGVSQCWSPPGCPYLIRVAGIPRSTPQRQTPTAALLFLVLLRPSRMGAPEHG